MLDIRISGSNRFLGVVRCKKMQRFIPSWRKSMGQILQYFVAVSYVIYIFCIKYVDEKNTYTKLLRLSRWPWILFFICWCQILALSWWLSGKALPYHTVLVFRPGKRSLCPSFLKALGDWTHYCRCHWTTHPDFCHIKIICVSLFMLCMYIYMYMFIQ